MATQASQPAGPDSVALTEIDNATSFREECRYQAACARCGATGAFDSHHAVQRQRCRTVGAPQYSPDNGLRLCPSCHGTHTSHQDVLPVGCLRDENIAFAARWLGPGPAWIYFDRYYQGRDARVDQLLEQQ